MSDLTKIEFHDISTSIHAKPIQLLSGSDNGIVYRKQSLDDASKATIQVIKLVYPISTVYHMLHCEVGEILGPSNNAAITTDIMLQKSILIWGDTSSGEWNFMNLNKDSDILFDAIDMFPVTAGQIWDSYVKLSLPL